jgi:hypothetical protein
MRKHQGLTVPGKIPTREAGVNRRELVRRLMPTGGTGFALTSMASGHYKDLAEIRDIDILTSVLAEKHGEAKRGRPESPVASKTSRAGPLTLMNHRKSA